MRVREAGGRHDVTQEEDCGFQVQLPTAHGGQVSMGRQLSEKLNCSLCELSLCLVANNFMNITPSIPTPSKGPLNKYCRLLISK